MVIFLYFFFVGGGGECFLSVDLRPSGKRNEDEYGALVEWYRHIKTEFRAQV